MFGIGSTAAFEARVRELEADVRVLMRERHGQSEIVSLLREVLRLGQQTHERTETLMPLTQEIRDLIARLNTRTNEMAEDLNAVAARIQALIDRLAGGATPAEVEQIRTELQGAVDSLEPVAAGLDAMGKVEDNPIPPPPPTEPPPA